MNKVKSSKDKARSLTRAKFCKLLKYYLWESNWSYLFMLVFAFLLVKFVIFPCASAILHTEMPFVVIESTSMEHCCGFDDYWISYGLWYVKHNISKAQFMGWPFVQGLYKGDVVIVKGINKDAYNIGDVIIFWPMGNKNAVPVIHRIVNKTCINGYCYYQTKGDNNQGQLPFEFNITQDAIVGKAIARIPKLGWIKLWLMGK